MAAESEGGVAAGILSGGMQGPAGLSGDAGARVKRRSAAAEFARTFARSRTGVAGVVVVVLAALFSFVGPLLYRTDQVHVNLGAVSQPPSLSHLLGTNAVGNDVLGQLDAGRPVIA